MELKRKNNKKMEFRDEKTFVHFTSSQLCRRFISENNLLILIFCCEGKGFHINNNSNIEEKVNIFNNKHKIVKNVKKTCDDCCCVCLEACISITKCGHLLCNGCSDSLLVKQCPYCRTYF
jgi:hypothetical protein